MHASRNSAIRDVACAGLLALVTLVYLTGLPHNLGAVDESNFIYEAQRLADGDVMYRDVFDLITPLSMYVTAFALRLFGNDMGVARATIAVVHALIVVAIFACARRLGARASVAGAAGLAHLALGQPTWAFVSQHWFATCANILVLLALLRCPWDRRPAWAAVPGIVTGILIGVQQQKGAPIAVCIVMLFMVASVISRRSATSHPARLLGAQVTYFSLGVAIVVVPLMTFLIGRAGIDPVVEALVTFPLVNYRQNYRSPWGGTQMFTAYYASFTFPTLLKFAPLSVAPLLVRLARVPRQRSAPTSLRLLTLLIFAAATTASIAYYPDIIHLAFIVPVFLVVAAEVIEWGLRAIPNARLATLVGMTIAVGCVGAIAWQLRANSQRLWSMFSVPHDTAFGRIDFNDAGLIPVIDKMRALLATAPVNEIFCYPSISGPYLWTGAKNPTRFQFFSTNYNDRKQVDEVIARLEARRTPFIVTSPLSARKDDPIVQYLTDHYEVVRFGYLPKIFLYTRVVPDAHPAP